MITVTQIDDVSEVKLNVQKLNLFVSEEIKAELLKIFQHLNIKMLINMEDVHFLDSSGFAVLLSVSKEAEKMDGQIIFCNLRESAQHLFEVLQLHKSFHIIADREKALHSFK
jgi:stage II sporulation protein AA (anti-sigma F factor antagonist)